MPSFLKQYEGSSKNRIFGFQRAVDSFLNNDYQNKTLIIVSDGCKDTCNIYENKYKQFNEIKLIVLDKQPLFSGNVREAGLRAATGNIINYLDTDDIIEKNHLSAINKGFIDNDCDFVFYNDFIKHLPFRPETERIVTLTGGSVGTSSIAHKNLPEISWKGCDGYGHDWTFIQRLIKFYPNYKKIEGCSYIVCHLPNGRET